MLNEVFSRLKSQSLIRCQRDCLFLICKCSESQLFEDDFFHSLLVSVGWCCSEPNTLPFKELFSKEDRISEEYLIKFVAQQNVFDAQVEVELVMPLNSVLE